MNFGINDVDNIEDSLNDELDRLNDEQDRLNDYNIVFMEPDIDDERNKEISEEEDSDEY